MFVATANSLNIPGPLLDRMEVIRIPVTPRREDQHRLALPPKQLKANGLEAELAIAESAIRDIIRYYTRESGAQPRARDRAIAARSSREIALKGRSPRRRARRSAAKTVTVDVERTSTRTSACSGSTSAAPKQKRSRPVTGLAWTEVGGDLLQIEARWCRARARTILTGQLGDVMKESASAALAVVRPRRAPRHRPGLPAEARRARIVPDGATPKDGPARASRWRPRWCRR